MPKARIVVEFIVVIALALGIWMVVRPKKDGGTSAKNNQSNPEFFQEEGSSQRLLRGSAKKKTPKSDDKKTNAETAAAVEPIPTAPGPDDSQLGTLIVIVVDTDGKRVKADGWLMSESCNWKVGIQSGVFRSNMEPFKCSINATLDLNGEQAVTEELMVSVEAGKETQIYLTLLPSTESATSAEIAHPGLGLLKQENYAEVVQVIPGSSAAENQLQVGDLVLSLGGVAVAELTQEEILETLQGEPGSGLSMVIAIEQNGELVDGDVELLRTILVE